MKLSLGLTLMIVVALIWLGIAIAALRKRDWPQVVMYTGFLIAQAGLVWNAFERGL